MSDSKRFRLIAVLICTIVAVLVLAPTLFRGQSFFAGKIAQQWPSQPIKLGLDLRGGTYVVMRVMTDEAVKSQLNSIASSAKSELRKLQVGILKARQVGERGIELSLLNDRGIDAVESFVRREYPQLRRLMDGGTSSPDQTVLTFELTEEAFQSIKADAVEQAIEKIRNRVDQFGVAEPTIQRSGEEQVMIQLPDVTDSRRAKETIGKVAKLEFRLVAEPGAAGSDTKRVKNRDGGETVVEDQVLMTGDAIERAQVDMSTQTNEIEVALKLTSVGARTFEQITGDNIGRQLAIILDGELYSAPRINDKIGGGNAVITGSFDPEEARKLAIVLRSGALPAPLETVMEATVGPSLGADSIKKGVIASLVGSLLVAVFMIMYYRKAGVLAVVCVVLNILFLLAVLALFNATLTLPGIAGLALTVGMAVDSNVIIYERIREELRGGASVKAAIDAGFFKAHWTILDANLTTLLSGVILYGFGTGPIRGFAVTLSVGVLTTIFAALVVSKLGFELFQMRTSKGELSI